MTNVLILVIMLTALLGSSAMVSFVGFHAMEKLGRRPSEAPRIFIKMIIVLFLVVLFAAALLSVVLLLFVKS